MSKFKVGDRVRLDRGGMGIDKSYVGKEAVIRSDDGDSCPRLKFDDGCEYWADYKIISPVATSSATDDVGLSWAKDYLTANMALVTQRSECRVLLQMLDEVYGINVTLVPSTVTFTAKDDE